MFEWDEAKRIANLQKHGLDFRDAGRLFDGRDVIVAPSKWAAEDRYVLTGLNEGKFYTIVWTWRGQARRIISFRRARHAEERAYRQIYG
ncbi:MAG: BrnT family toxin [Methylobacteriaceae bacterium]|nr:BrnT family toxin [Methylobacteriaceae bacterium]